MANDTEIKNNVLIMAVMALVFIGFGFFLYDLTHTYTNSSTSEVAKSVKQKTPEEIRKERIEGGFSAWDGSHRGLEKLIKKTMNDPDSYQHEETSYSDKGDYLLVKTTFRGKNAFGGVVKNWVIAKADLSGNMYLVTG